MSFLEFTPDVSLHLSFCLLPASGVGFQHGVCSCPWSTPVEGLRSYPEALAKADAQVCRSLGFGKDGVTCFLLLLRMESGRIPRSVLPCPLLQVSGDAGQSWGEGKEEGEEEMFFFFSWKQ